MQGKQTMQAITLYRMKTIIYLKELGAIKTSLVAASSYLLAQPASKKQATIRSLEVLAK